MVFNPIFIIVAIFAVGKKLSDLHRNLRGKQFGGAKVDSLFLALMMLTFFVVYFFTN